MSNIEGRVENGRYRTEVQADSTGTWAGNMIRFDDADLAEKYVIELSWRWTAVREWRVVNAFTGQVVRSSV